MGLAPAHNRCFQQVFDKAAGFSNAEFCYGNPAINISFCPFTTDHQSFNVLAYNPQGRASKQVRPCQLTVANCHSRWVPWPRCYVCPSAAARPRSRDPTARPWSARPSPSRLASWACPSSTCSSTSSTTKNACVAPCHCSVLLGIVTRCHNLSCLSSGGCFHQQRDPRCDLCGQLARCGLEHLPRRCRIACPACLSCLPVLLVYACLSTTSRPIFRPRPTDPRATLPRPPLSPRPQPSSRTSSTKSPSTRLTLTSLWYAGTCLKPLLPPYK